MEKIIIVGGVAGGATAVARLRRLNEKLKIILIERGEYISFANCGLPYYIGDIIKERSKLILQTPKAFSTRFNVDVRIKNEAVHINTNTKTVTIIDHTTNQTYLETYDKLLLSPGATPLLPPIKGIHHAFTLRNIPDTDKIKNFISTKKPKNAVIIGGGLIGIEILENLCHLGIETSLIEASNQILPHLDYEMAIQSHFYLKSNGVKLYLNQKVFEILEENGKFYVNIGDIIKTDMVFLATGVKVENKIALECGLKIGETGGILVNDQMQTSNEDIYAVGDAIEVLDFVTKKPALYPLAGPANKQARIAADNICGIKSKYNNTQATSIIKLFDTTIATTGINEKTAKHHNIDYDKAYLWLQSNASYYPGAFPITIKAIFEKSSGIILGGQFLGKNGVDKRCDILSVAIRHKMTATDLTELELSYSPPYSSAKDPINMLGYHIENLVYENTKQFHWHDVDSITNDSTKLLLDVRTKEEFNKGHINGFINIPLDDLRNNLNEFDKTKTFYICCHSGVRSYIASRILEQNGFNSYNLSGGYRLYKEIFS